MTLLKIYTAPDPVLKKVAAPVATITDETRQILSDMLETMYAAPGIGLAAPQVGMSQRLIVLDVSRDKENPQPYKMVNPEIIAVSEEDSRYEEGCLSLPQHYADVVRPARVTLKYLDENGSPHTLEADGLLATCIQHEMDHLEGILFVDHISALKRTMILRKLLKTKKEQQENAAHKL
jgi:peptide deformylase